MNISNIQRRSSSRSQSPNIKANESNNSKDNVPRLTNFGKRLNKILGIDRNGEQIEQNKNSISNATKWAELEKESSVKLQKLRSNSNLKEILPVIINLIRDEFNKNLTNPDVVDKNQKKLQEKLQKEQKDKITTLASLLTGKASLALMDAKFPNYLNEKFNKNYDALHNICGNKEIIEVIENILNIHKTFVTNEPKIILAKLDALNTAIYPENFMNEEESNFGQKELPKYNRYNTFGNNSTVSPNNVGEVDNNIKVIKEELEKLKAEVAYNNNNLEEETSKSVAELAVASRLVNSSDVTKNQSLKQPVYTSEEQQIAGYLYGLQIKLSQELYHDTNKLTNSKQNVNISNPSLLTKNIAQLATKLAVKIPMEESIFSPNFGYSDNKSFTREQLDKLCEYYSDSPFSEQIKLEQQQKRLQSKMTKLNEIKTLSEKISKQINCNPSEGLLESKISNELNLKEISQVLDFCKKEINRINNKIDVLNKVTDLFNLRLSQPYGSRGLNTEKIFNKDFKL